VYLAASTKVSAWYATTEFASSDSFASVAHGLALMSAGYACRVSSVTRT
jgi:hypothetical protein